jgi:peptide/nickel transport system substrate-binding protein
MLSGRRLMIGFGLLIIASMVLAACQPAPPPPAAPETIIVTEIIEGTPVEVIVVVTPTPPPVGERTLVICQGQEPDTLYAYEGAMLAKSHVLEAVYDGPIDNTSFAYQAIILEKLPSLADDDASIEVITVNEGDTVVDVDQAVVTLEPGVMIVPAGETEAIEYEGGPIEMEQLSATFTLLSGLMWSDGTPLTAQDSVYSFNLQADPDTNVPKFVLDRTASYEALDEVTTMWTGLPGYKDSTYFINFFGPSPEHIWGQFTAAELRTAEEAARAPVGYGPYIVDEWVTGDSVRLHRNPNYHRADEGLPRFDHLVYRFVGTPTPTSPLCSPVNVTSSTRPPAWTTRANCCSSCRPPDSWKPPS